MASFSWTEPIVAPPSVVWDVLTDHRRYPEFTPIRRVGLEAEGDPAPNGVGAIRKLHAVGPPIREVIREFVPEQKMVYELISGAPVRDHFGTITLEPAPGGTRMTYALTSTPKIRGTGFAILGIMKLSVGDLVKRIVSESEKRAAAAR
jgi:uncharacterized protein YndB with AHSA1/START domain